ncbi:unnamed protein product [Adineta ricciae]|uniref:Uncharacterized protein n=1 Tax=Adineta ricciae TaxID=249248 RepID=A0A815B3V4_ADIRI|nr:unnamed protein product [Adineta ricciae]CAF1265511.1 unnamed protein product [Adineta ricciae]
MKSLEYHGTGRFRAGLFDLGSGENTFGGIKIPYVLIDSGSNSSLLPLPMNVNNKLDLNELMRCFPSSGFLWTISTAYGVGLLPNTSLHIKRRVESNGADGKILCHLHADLKMLQFELPYLRFTLDKESIQVLTGLNETLFSEADKSLLEDTLRFLNNFEDHFPSMINTKKREYCLLGQHFLKTVCSIQVNDTMIFINKDKLRNRVFPCANTTIDEIANYLYYQRPSFSKTEKFLLCEDDEHGGPDLLNVPEKQIAIDE